jgi:hypothetical protein
MFIKRLGINMESEQRLKMRWEGETERKNMKQKPVKCQLFQLPLPGSSSPVKPPACMHAQGRLLGIQEAMLPVLAREAIALSGGCDAGVVEHAPRILAELAREEDKFASTLEAGAALLQVVHVNAAPLGHLQGEQLQENGVHAGEKRLGAYQGGSSSQLQCCSLHAGSNKAAVLEYRRKELKELLFGARRREAARAGARRGGRSQQQQQRRQ